MKNYLSFVLYISLLLSGQITAQTSITAAEIKEHIAFLASDKMKGREIGSPELIRAADFVEKEFNSYDGLSPFFGLTYRQVFPFISGIVPANSSRFIIKTNDISSAYMPGVDFISSEFSDTNSISSSLVFAGYGISAPEIGYDDYQDIDAKNKVVIIFRSTPDSGLYVSPFQKHSEMRTKAYVAQKHGAIGIIFINGYFTESDALISPVYDGAPVIENFPVIQMKRTIAEKLIKKRNLDLRYIFESINFTKKPSSFDINNTSVQIKSGIRCVFDSSFNVAALLPGSDPQLKKEFIVIGAHMDHLGMGGKYSKYTGLTPKIHNGADDNASGVAGILELAKKFAASKIKPRRSIIFVIFSGEESGFLGSQFFVDNLPVKSTSISAMINLDMIGRLRNQTLTVNGTGSCDTFENLLNEYNKKYNFKLLIKPEGYGGSDNNSFYFKHIPVLFFFTGFHDDYHMPSDDIKKISFAGEKKVLDYVYDITSELTNSLSSPIFHAIGSD